MKSKEKRSFFEVNNERKVFNELPKTSKCMMFRLFIILFLVQKIQSSCALFFFLKKKNYWKLRLIPLFFYTNSHNAEHQRDFWLKCVDGIICIHRVSSNGLMVYPCFIQSIRRNLELFRITRSALCNLYILVIFFVLLDFFLKTEKVIN